MWTWLAGSIPWVGYFLLIVACAAGLFINLLGLPGIWLIVLAAIGFGSATGIGIYIGWAAILGSMAIGLVAEVVEFFAAAAGTRQAGGSKRGMAGALLGGLLGAIAFSVLIPIPILGTIIGAIAGCGLGAFLIEWGWVGSDSRQSAAIAAGAAKGRFIGMVLKSVFGILMTGIVLLDALPLHRNTTAPAVIPSTTPTSLPTTAPSSNP